MHMQKLFVSLHTHTYTYTRKAHATHTHTAEAAAAAYRYLRENTFYRTQQKQQQQRTDIYTWEELKSRENTFYRENSFYVERTYSRYEHLGGIGGINAKADFIILAIMLFHRHLPPLAAVLGLGFIILPAMLLHRHL